MCGISAVVGRFSAAGAREAAGAMHAPIRHRGPDGEGFLLVDDAMRATRGESLGALPASGEARVAFAFRRLKILDLSEAAAQPICSDRGTAWLVFNGEIYNYRELRAELLARGRSFRGHGDAEVVIAAYEEWGEECFRRFDGMWAMVIADLARRRVVVSRDRLGIKPLFWSLDDARLLFASEAKQIIAATGRAEANVTLVMRYLRGNRLPCFDETFFRGIRMMPAATWASVPLDEPVTSPEFRPYWDLRDYVASEPAGTYDAALDEVRGLLEATVDSHLQADVATGSLLSGGLDSGVLAAMAARRAAVEGRTLPTFSFGFRDRAPRFCEMPYVDAIARVQPSIVNHETSFDGGWIAAHTGDAIRALEEPPLALAAVAQYRVFELCREFGTTVVLDGEGSDEIFAGYPYHHRTLFIDRLRRRRFGSALRELRAMAARYDTSAAGMLASFVVPSIQRRIRRPSYAWLDGAGIVPERTPLDVVDRSRDASAVNRHLYDSVRWGNVKIVLGYTDRNAMAHSVEARVPYMAHRLVERAFTLPDTFKAGGGDRKRILRDIGRGLLPPEVTERKDRMGFGTPDELFLRNGLWGPVVETIAAARVGAMPFLRQREMDAFLADYRAGRHNDFRAVWRLYALAAWRTEFDVTGL